MNLNRQWQQYKLKFSRIANISIEKEWDIENRQRKVTKTGSSGEVIKKREAILSIS